MNLNKTTRLKEVFLFENNWPILHKRAHRGNPKNDSFSVCSVVNFEL
jgi:hypothetical protein